MKMSKAKLAMVCLTIVVFCLVMFSVGKYAIEVLYIGIAMILVFHDDIIERRVKSETWKRRISRICGLCYVILMIITLISSHREATRREQECRELRASLSGIDIISGLDTTGILPYEIVTVSNLTCELADANIGPAKGIYEGISGKIRVRGELTNPNWNNTTRPTWKAEDMLFLSETSGEMTNSSLTSGHCVSQQLGYVISIDETGARVRFEPGLCVYLSDFGLGR